MKRGHYKPRKPNKTIEEVRKIFGKEGYTIKSNSFIKSAQKMECICPNGHKLLMSLTGFKWGYRCKKCSGKEKYTYEFVKKYFLDNSCELISKTYKNTCAKLEYKCSCGNISFIAFVNFRRGVRCKKCATKKAMKTNSAKRGGLLYFQTEEFKKRRKKIYFDDLEKIKIANKNRKETCMKKYGNPCFLSSKLGKEKIKNVLMKKYGVEYAMQIDSAKEKFKQTLLTKYGIPSLAYLSRPSSKQSQKLFWEIQKLLPNKYKEKSHFAELNGEFVSNKGKQYFKYDFVNSILMKAIEYNGYNFHPKPDQLDEEIGWCAFHPNKTAKEAKEYEDGKYKILENRGFKILTVWDYEYRQDFDALLNKCVSFLMSDILLI